MGHLQRIRDAFLPVLPLLDERSRRLVLAALSRAEGRGGVALVAQATGVARSTLGRGRRDLRDPEAAPPLPPRVRRPGAGRKPLTDHDPGLKPALEALIDPLTRGDPESPLRWTCKSTRQLAGELRRQGHRVSHQKVSELLHEMGYSLQANRKTKEASSHPDRNEQFEAINEAVEAFQRAGQPAVSVDTKKKELVGEYRNGGEEWQPKGQPEKVRVHDFPDATLGKAIPYGVYDLQANEGWVSVGTDHDTAEFAIATLEQWWGQMGKPRYPEATDLLVTADCGGSNGNRTQLWKVGLQQFADVTNLRVWVKHFPPGTSKWNKIEHRMFSHITQNWRGRPLVSHEAVVNLIASTRTTKGLRIQAGLDTGHYPTGKKATDEQLLNTWFAPGREHGEWNYLIIPRPQLEDSWTE